jgi:hypothetical protein
MQHTISLVSRPHNALGSTMLKPLSSWFEGHRTFLMAHMKSFSQKEATIVKTIILGGIMLQLVSLLTHGRVMTIFL